MRTALRYLGIVVLSGIGAVLGLHLWMDHQSLHALIGIENARQQAQLREGK